MNLHQNLWRNCKEGKLREARQALEAGTDPNTTGDRNMTCLMVAAENNHDQVVALLLAQPGIQVNARDKMNFTALHWACQMGSVASLTIQLAVPGLLLNESNSGGWTPILAAIFYGKTDAVRLMAQVKEVDLDVKDSHNRSLEDIASRYASIPGPGEEIVAVLTETRKRRHLKRQQRIVSKVFSKHSR